MKTRNSNQNPFVILLSLVALILFINCIWLTIDDAIYKYNQKVAWEEYIIAVSFDTDPQCIHRHYADSMRAISWKRERNYGQPN